MAFNEDVGTFLVTLSVKVGILAIFYLALQNLLNANLCLYLNKVNDGESR